MAVVSCSSPDRFKVHTDSWSEDAAPAATAAAVAARPLPQLDTALPPPAKPKPPTFVDRAGAALVLLQTKKAWGTGFVVGGSGGERVIVTNNHVIADAIGKKGGDGVIRCFFLTALGEARATTAKIVARDAKRDLAFLSTRFEDPRVASLSFADATAERSNVIVAGFPFGNLSMAGENSSPSFNMGSTDGVVAHKFGGNYIKVVAGIHPGNSGGPVLDGSGAVIGVATLQELSKQSLSGAAPFNYAIPAADVVALAKKHKIVLRGGTPIARIAADMPADISRARASVVVVEAAGQRLMGAVIAKAKQGSWIMSDGLVGNVSGAFATFADAHKAPLQLLGSSDGVSLFFTTDISTDAIALSKSNAVSELEPARRLRTTLNATAEQSVLVASVRRSADADAAATHVLVDNGMADDSMPSGLLLDARGDLLGFEVRAIVGTNLRGALPADRSWAFVDQVTGEQMATFGGHGVVDKAAGVSATFPRLAFKRASELSVTYRSESLGVVREIEAFPKAPADVATLLGRPSTKPEQAIKVARDQGAVVRIDQFGANDSVRRVVTGTSYLRIATRGGDESSFVGTVRSLNAPARGDQLDDWATALGNWIEKRPKQEPRKVALASTMRTGDAVPVCNALTWPTVTSPDKTYRVTMPCRPTKVETLVGTVITSQFVSRPSKNHRFEMYVAEDPATAASEETGMFEGDDISSVIHVQLLDRLFADVQAHTDLIENTSIVALEEGEDESQERGALFATQGEGSLRDGRRIFARVARDRGRVYVATALVPASDEDSARRFLESLILLAHTEAGAAVRLELTEAMKSRTKRQDHQRKVDAAERNRRAYERSRGVYRVYEDRIEQEDEDAAAKARMEEELKRKKEEQEQEERTRR